MATQSLKRSYYDILHVSRDAPAEIIRGSYRTLMQQLKNHPDLGGDAANAALINEAYAILGDPERRAEYDARLHIMSHISQGVTDMSPDSPAVASGRILDPFRECVFCETPHELGKKIKIEADCANCGSPLHPAGNRRMELRGQRAVARLDRRQDISFFTQWPQATGFYAHTDDISPHGLCLVSRQQLRKGQRIKIASRVVDAVAMVTHCNSERQNWTTQYVAGVSFVTARFSKVAGGFVSDRV